MSAGPMDRIHGGPDREELERLGLAGLDLDGLLDFSVNVSPYGRLPALDRAIGEARLDRYPEPRGGQARRALAAAWGVPVERVALGNGAAELLFTLVQLLCAGGRTLLTVEPTFSEPTAAATAWGARVVTWRAREQDGFRVDVGEVAQAARRCGAAAVYLCNPQNPTGRALAIDEVAALAAALGRQGTRLILDEAFLSLSTRWEEGHRPLAADVVRVRSFTKEHGVPGLRMGALMGPVELVQRLEAARSTWTVGAAAQAAIGVCATPEAEAHVADVRARWLQDAGELAHALAAAGHEVLPTDTVFLLMRTRDASQLRNRLLLRHQILIRDCASFGLPGHVRLCGRPEDDRRRLLAALDGQG
jgi:histidinol-phosphate/aromatic aminotransferase/cobyric acid decarboxylase-like protein